MPKTSPPPPGHLYAPVGAQTLQADVMLKIIDSVMAEAESAPPSRSRLDLERDAFNRNQALLRSVR